MTDRNPTSEGLALQGEFARLLRVQRVAGVGFIDWDLATDRVELSEGACRLLGVERGIEPMLIGRLVDMVPADELPLVSRSLERAARGEQAYDLDHRAIRPDGRVIWVHAQAELTRDGAGNPKTLLGTIIDITARKNAELALRDSEARLRLALDATRIGIWDWDLRTDDWRANETYFRMLGYDPTAHQQHRQFWSERMHPEDRERAVEAMLAVRDQGQPGFDLEYRLRHADGSYRWINSIGRAIEFDERGRAVRMLGLRIDVNERKLAEARMGEIEARAAHAQRLDAIGQLTGGIAHDFNNLLTVIIGNSDDLAEELRDRPRLAAMARMVRTAGERGAELTSRLLSFARRQVLEPQRIEPPTAIQGMLALLRRTLGGNVETEALADADTWTVYVDPGQLELAILNLCINARDAMPDGGTLRIETANVVLDQEYAAADFDIVPGEYVMIAITDTGAGIAPEHLERVFDPFFTTKAVGKGTGLGLSMVYGFTKQSGGTVKIRSEVGVGTTVKLYLPRAGGLRAPDESPGGRAEPPSDLRGDEVILLVEDDALVRNHAARLLQGLGYRVLIAANGPEALDIARSDQPIDLLFADVIMPGGMTGPVLAAQVQALRSHLPVLFTSGYTDSAIASHGRLDAGAMLLHKPYDRRTLAERIRQTLATADGTG